MNYVTRYLVGPLIASGGILVTPNRDKRDYFLKRTVPTRKGLCR